MSEEVHIEMRILQETSYHALFFFFRTIGGGVSSWGQHLVEIE